MGALTALLLGSQQSRELILAAVIPPQGALLQPVALLGDGDGGERLPPRWMAFTGLTISAGRLDILNES